MKSGRSEETRDTVQPQSNKMLRLQETSKCTEGLQVSQARNEQVGLQDQQGTFEDTQGELSRVHTETEFTSPEDVGTSHNI